MKRFSIAVFFMLFMLHAAAQGREPGAVPPSVIPAAADSLHLPRRVSAARDTAARGNVIQLDEIQIQGEVEEPSVIILPKRIEPEMQADSLDRSFSQEIRKNTGEIPTPDKAINRVEPVKSIKKEIEKKRK